MANILLEVTPRTRGGDPITIRMAHASANSAGTIVDGKQWLPLISQRPTISMDLMDSEGNLAPSTIRRGSLEFRLGEVYDNEIWSTYVWNNAHARIWLGEMGAPFEDYIPIHTGAVSAIRRNGATASLELIGPDAELDVDLLTAIYAGTGLAEGPVVMKGKLKPWCSGYAKNVDPVLVDPVYYIYQVHGYGPIQDIAAVYERAEALDFARMKGSVSTFEELAGLALAPSEWAICLPLGMFRLGGAPRFKITADVRGAKDGGATPSTIQTIAQHLLKQAGITSERISAFAAFAGVTWDEYVSSQVKVGDLLRSMLAQAGGIFFADGSGVWHGEDFYAYKTPLPLTSDRSTLPLVRPETIQQLTAADPVWKVEVGYDRCWSVHSKDQVSPALDEQLTAIVDSNQQLVGQIADLGDRVDNATGVNLYPLITRIDGVAELGQRNLNANDKAARAYRDEAFAKVETLRSDVLADGESWAEAIDNLTTTTGDLQSAIGNEAVLRTNGDAANAAQITIVGTKADDNAAAIVTERNARTTALDAQATLLSELEAQVDTANAGLISEATARTSAIAAEASARNSQIANLNQSFNAAISTEANARATADSAATTRMDQISVRADDAHSRITSEQNARASADSANASAISTVQSNLNGTNSSLAAVQTQASTISNRLGVVEGKYVLKVQGGSDIAGIQLAAGGGTSTAIFQAGAFAFRNPATNGVDNLMEYVNGELRVRNALFGTANIGSAHIQDLQIGTNKLALNSVTVTHYAERTSAIFGNNTHTPVLSYSLNTPVAADLIVNLNATQGFPSGDRLWETILYIDGIQIAGGGGQKTADTVSLAGRLRVGAGTHTMTVSWRGGDSSVRLASMRAIIQQVMR